MQVPPTSHEEVVKLVLELRTRIAQIVAPLSDDEMQRIPGPQNDRSVKDLLAHLVWWEQFMMTRILLAKSGTAGCLIQNLDQLNEGVFQSHRDLSVSTIQTCFEQGHHCLQAFLDNLTWEEINGGLTFNEQPVSSLIAGNTFGHYMQHLPQLERYVDGLG